MKTLLFTAIATLSLNLMASDVFLVECKGTVNTTTVFGSDAKIEKGAPGKGFVITGDEFRVTSKQFMAVAQMAKNDLKLLDKCQASLMVYNGAVHSSTLLCTEGRITSINRSEIDDSLINDFGANECRVFSNKAQSEIATLL